MSRAERLFGLAQYLRTQAGRRLDEIAHRFDVSERTVFRDLASLDEQGIPLEHLDGGRYRILESRQRPPSLDSTDLALVRVALPAEPESDAGPLADRWAKLVDKIESALRGRASGSDAGEPDPTEVRALARVLDELGQWIAHHRPVSIRYRSISGGLETERGVDPWQIFERAGAWYLVGRCHLHDEPRLFRLDRILEVRPGRGTFLVPEDFDAQRFLAEAWSSLVLGSASGSGARIRRRR